MQKKKLKSTHFLICIYFQSQFCPVGGSSGPKQKENIRLKYNINIYTMPLHSLKNTKSIKNEFNSKDFQIWSPVKDSLKISSFTPKKFQKNPPRDHRLQTWLPGFRASEVTYAGKDRVAKPAHIASNGHKDKMFIIFLFVAISSE